MTMLNAVSLISMATHQTQHYVNHFYQLSYVESLVKHVSCDTHLMTLSNIEYIYTTNGVFIKSTTFETRKWSPVLGEKINIDTTFVS